MEVNHEGSELPTPVLGLALRCSLNFPGSNMPRLLQKTGNLSYVLEHGYEKQSTDPKYKFNAYVTMEENQEGSELHTPVVVLVLRGSLNLPGSKRPDYSKRLVTLATYWSMGMRKSLLTPNTTYVTMEVNLEGSKSPTPVVGLALRGSLTLPGSKSPDY